MIQKALRVFGLGMKPLTGLPVESLVRVSEKADIPMKDLLQVVQEVENNASAAYLARYRADLCGGLDEGRLHEIIDSLRAEQDLIDHRISMLASLGQRGVLTDGLRQQLEAAADRQELNDIYHPYRERRRKDSADIALGRGLDPLARSLWFQKDDANLEEEAGRHVNEEAGIADAAAALDGACAIAARWLGDKPEIVQKLRTLFLRDCEIRIVATAAGRKDPRAVELDGFQAKLAAIPWQKRLAIRRGVRKGLLQAHSEVPGDGATRYLERCLIKDEKSPYAPYLKRVVEKSLRNGLSARVAHDIRQQLDRQADDEALKSFRKTLRNALLAPPAHGLRILGLETSRAGGWRAALIGPDGELIDHAIIQDENSAPEASSRDGDAPADTEQELSANGTVPATKEAAAGAAEGADPETVDSEAVSADAEEPSAPPAEPKAQASDGDTSTKADSSGSGGGRTRRVELSDFLASHDVDLIVFPAGPGLRATERFLRTQVRRAGKTSVSWLAARNGGTWAYAASKQGKRELQGVETAVRSAASLARRVQDPLDEMVKADPRTLAIGPNSYEVEPERLRKVLRRTIESVAHEAGIDLNRASIPLLCLTPGLTEKLAERIVKHRQAEGPFKSRDAVRNVHGFSTRIFAQAAGFLRVRGEDPLDGTGVHPDSRELIDRIAQATDCDAATLLAEPERLDAVDPEQFATPERSAQLVQAALRELKPDRRAPRGVFKVPERPVPLRTDDELRPGAKVNGVVKGVADYGVFVDIGADQNALLHVSQIHRDRVTDSKPALEAGETVEVFIQAAHPNAKGISVSMWEPRASGPAPPHGGRKLGQPRQHESPGRRGGRKGGEKRDARPPKRVFGPGSKKRSDRSADYGKMSLQKKLDLLSDKYRTKV